MNQNQNQNQTQKQKSKPRKQHKPSSIWINGALVAAIVGTSGYTNAMSVRPVPLPSSFTGVAQTQAAAQPSVQRVAVKNAQPAAKAPQQADAKKAPSPKAAKPSVAKAAGDTPDATKKPDKASDRPLVQIAILLDTSNSMDGLISQAKTHLWKIVNEFVAAKQNGVRPDLRVALYEYGNNRLPAGEGHIRQVVAFTDDLDKVSEELFALRTNGGNEYCGHVIRQAAQSLNWSKKNSDFKAIFIAGNEPFTQGSVPYADACREAVSKGILVNTIFCGNESGGINGKWKDGAVLADGSFTNIDQNQATVHIKAPQDSEIVTLNGELNKTYIAFGARGQQGAANQVEQDKNAAKLSSAVLVQRAVTKQSAYYSNASWDLCDAWSQKKVKIEDIKEDQLPENMKKMTIEQRKKYVADMIAKRKAIQDKIKKLSGEREKYVSAERRKLAEKEGKQSLDEAIVNTVREQAGKKAFKFEK